MQWLYLVVALVGTVMPLRFLVQFLIDHGLQPSLFVAQLFQNNISAFFGVDVIVSSFALWVFVFSEGRRQRMGRLWVYVICNLAVGVSLALPLFLFFRERRIAAEV